VGPVLSAEDAKFARRCYDKHGSMTAFGESVFVQSQQALLDAHHLRVVRGRRLCLATCATVIGIATVLWFSQGMLSALGTLLVGVVAFLLFSWRIGASESTYEAEMVGLVQYHDVLAQLAVDSRADRKSPLESFAKEAMGIARDALVWSLLA
jgi:hypothetical protein